MGYNCAGTWVTDLIVLFGIAQVDSAKALMSKVQVIDSVLVWYCAGRNTIPVQCAGDAKAALVELHMVVPADGRHQVSIRINDLWQLLG
jgi:hypothetical protein